MRIRALLPLSGIVFVVLSVIGIAVSGSTPAPDAPADEVVSFYSDEESRARIGIWFFAFAMPFLPLFASSLADVGRPEGRDSRLVWRRLLLLGAAIMSAMLGVAITTQLALADSTDPEIAPEVMQALNVIGGHVVYALLPATGTMMLGAAGWLLGRDGVHRWLGRAALVLGVGLFVPFVGVLALILTLVWIIVASIALYRARDAEPALARATWRTTAHLESHAKGRGGEVAGGVPTAARRARRAAPAQDVVRGRPAEAFSVFPPWRMSVRRTSVGGVKRPPPNMRDWFEPPELERCPQCQRQSALKTLPAEYVICTECGVVGFDSERDSDHEH